MQNIDSIKNILFDFGNVIIDIDIEGATEQIGNFKAASISDEDFRDHVYALNEKYEIGAISNDLFINGILKYSNINVQAKDVIDAWNSMLVGIPEYRFGLLEQLSANFNLLMLSNTNKLHIDWITSYLKSRFDIDDFEERFFSNVYYSHLINARKPNRDAFQHVIDNSNIDPEHTLFIDDLQINIDGASKLGFQTLLSPPEVEIAETLKLLGYY